MMEMNCSTWDSLSDDEDICCNGEDSFQPKFSREFFYRQEESESDEDTAYSSECDAMPYPLNREQQQIAREDIENMTHSLNSVENLIRKFSTIELLRQKQKLKKHGENTANHHNTATCSTHNHSQGDEDAMNPEVLLGSNTYAQKCKAKWERKKDSDEDSEEDFHVKNVEDDKDIDEVVQMLLTSSLSSESDKQLTPVEEEIDDASSHRKKERYQYDDCCQPLEDSSANYLSDSSENASETEIEIPSSEKHIFDDLTADCKAEASKDLNTIFDGYDIDHLSSFHDWMIDDILSRPLNISHDNKCSLCSLCNLYDGSKHVCILPRQ